jgi:HAD superfamily hydrolase (TIGR01459 family)
MPTPIHNTLQDVFNQYDAYLIDAWGVLHDGGQVFPEALACLSFLKAQSKQVVILSNAARRRKAFDQELAKSGINDSLFDFSLSSGELFWQQFNQGRFKLGHYCLYLGPQRSRGILAGLDLQLVDDVAKADFIINAGVEGNQLDASSQLPLLKLAADRQLPMLCVNPDLVAIRHGVRGISAGAIARDYERFGGYIEYFGKPYPDIYEECFKRLPSVPLSRMLMIGDGLQTDILGANSAGIDSLFVTQGIYREQIAAIDQLSTIATSANSLLDLFLSEGAQPDYIIERLQS